MDGLAASCVKKISADDLLGGFWMGWFYPAPSKIMLLWLQGSRFAVYGIYRDIYKKTPQNRTIKNVLLQNKFKSDQQQNGCQDGP